MSRPCWGAGEAGVGRQVTHAHRLIDPAEYDAAVRRVPGECPLFVMGDLRSGRQLLEDFAADTRLTVSRMASCRRGSPELQRFGRALARTVVRLEARAATAASTAALGGVTSCPALSGPLPGTMTRPKGLDQR